jgi:hypothetical protein
LNCVEIGGTWWLFIARKNAQERRRNGGGGGGEGRSSGHKLNIINGITNRIISLVTPSIILLV